MMAPVSTRAPRRREHEYFKNTGVAHAGWNSYRAGGGFFSDAAKLTERFTRVAQDYVVYEYACHEGNYMMSSALEAARQ